MGVSQTGNDVRFTNGWQQFVTDNSIVDGDFFVFRYDGYKAFDFKLLGRTQCQKDVDKVNRKIPQKNFRVKEEEVDEEADIQEAYEVEKEDESDEMVEEGDGESTEEDEEMEDEEDKSTEEELSGEVEEEVQQESSAEKANARKHKCYGRGRHPGGSNYSESCNPPTF